MSPTRTAAIADEVDRSPATTVAAERLRIGTEWVVAGRVRLRRRIVTERRTVEVDVRREVLELAGETVDFRDGRLVGTELDGPPVGPPPATAPPVALVLHEELPIFAMQVRPYERVVVTTVRVQGGETVADTVRHEVVDVSIHPSHENPHEPKEN